MLKKKRRLGSYREIQKKASVTKSLKGEEKAEKNKNTKKEKQQEGANYKFS